MIIGVTGYARNGKDTVAKIVSDLAGFEIVSFARPLKDACKVIFGWSDDHVNGSLKEVVDPHYGISPRQALQLLGTEWGQFTLCEKVPEFKEITGRSLWVKRAMKESEGKNIVIPDVRFLHEAEAIKERGGIIIRVIRRGYETKSNHASERELEQIKADYSVLNDSTIEELGMEIETILSFAGVL